MGSGSNCTTGTKRSGVGTKRRGNYKYALHGSDYPLDRILTLLKDADLKRAGDGWMAQCPAHVDVNPSLSISEGDDGRVLLHCHTGCETEEIVAALGIQMRDLFPHDYASTAVSSGSSNKTLSTKTKRRRRDTQENGEETDWQKLASRFECSVHSIRHVGELAQQLNVHTSALRALSAGWKGTESDGVLTFPEYDAEGQVIGIATRTKQGRKRMLRGGQRGLYLPKDWKDRQGPILIAEGASDTATLNGMEIAGIGRPSATGGVDLLANLLLTMPTNRPIIVLGEYDMKPDGRWPGLEGAKKVARVLAQRLGRRVRWALPPNGAKDVREWFKENTTECREEHILRGLGAQFHEEIWAQSEPVEPSRHEQRDEFIDSKTFLRTEYSRTWLIRGLLVEGQPAIVGGPKKSMKTSLLVDLAVSLAAEERFLGRFGTEHSTTIGIICAESGEATLQETFRRVAESKGIHEPEYLPIHWKFRMPRLSFAEDLERLATDIKEHGLEAVLFDPVYLGLLAGNSDVQASNLFQMGPLLADLTSLCLDLGATPVLTHHTRMHAGNYQNPPDLEDLAFAGFQEFARQWLLVGRREKYEPGSGHHELWLNAGGSAGQSGCWAVNVDEGQLRSDFSGRTWDVTVHSAHEERQVVKDRRQLDQEEKRRAQLEEDQQSVIGFLQRHPKGETKTGIRDGAGVPGNRLGQALTDLLQHGVVETTQVEKRAGRGKHKHTGFRLRESEE